MRKNLLKEMFLRVLRSTTQPVEGRWQSVRPDSQLA